PVCSTTIGTRLLIYAPPAACPTPQRLHCNSNSNHFEKSGQHYEIILMNRMASLSLHLVAVGTLLLRLARVPAEDRAPSRDASRLAATRDSHRANKIRRFD